MADAADLGDLFAIDVVDIRGVPTKVFRNAPPSLRAIWDLSAGFAGERLLGLRRRTDHLQGRAPRRACGRPWLRVQAVEPGDRVAIAMRNCRVGRRVLGGAGDRSGRRTAERVVDRPELAYGLADSGSVVLFADDERAERLAPHLGETGVRATVLVRTVA